MQREAVIGTYTMTVLMMISLAAAGIAFWVGVVGWLLNMVGALFYSRLKPKKGFLFWLMVFLVPLAVFIWSAYASKMHLGDGVWW